MSIYAIIGFVIAVSICGGLIWYFNRRADQKALERTRQLSGSAPRPLSSDELAHPFGQPPQPLRPTASVRSFQRRPTQTGTATAAVGEVDIPLDLVVDVAQAAVAVVRILTPDEADASDEGGEPTQPAKPGPTPKAVIGDGDEVNQTTLAGVQAVNIGAAPAVADPAPDEDTSSGDGDEDDTSVDSDPTTPD